jgi:hypothetical protein
MHLAVSSGQATLQGWVAYWHAPHSRTASSCRTTSGFVEKVQDVVVKR